ncbi:MAG: hypothetical protein RI985_501 [Chloroflexota bacterium]|jgi:hypothetical protein
MGQMHHIREEDMVLLTALLDGALNPQETKALRQRLAQDDALHEAYLDLELIHNQLRHLPPVRVPRSLRLDEVTFTRARGWRWWLSLPPGGLLTPTLSAVASVAVAIFFVQELMAPSLSPAVPMTMVAPAAELSVVEEAPAAESRMLESAPMMDSVPASEDAALMADSASASEDASVMAASIPEAELAPADSAPMPLADMEYQQYGAAWINWAVAGIVMSAIAVATSLRWLMQVWWRQRHQRS